MDVTYDDSQGMVSLVVSDDVPRGELRALPGWKYEVRARRHLAFPRQEVLDLAARHGLTVSNHARGRIEHRMVLVAASRATDAPPTATIALSDRLRKYQRAGTAYALDHGKSINADQMGLGKTRQAIAAIETRAQYPALIICPATLRGNWVREYNDLVPDRKVAEADAREIPVTDVIVMSYEGFTVAQKSGALREMPFGTLVCDEAHYLKEWVAGRTIAVRNFARTLPDDALVLFLTGTPVVNRPKELIAPLSILGYLSRTGGDGTMSIADYTARYCKDNAHRGDTGSNNESELAQWLRATCLMRRLKADVLAELPPKQRAPQWYLTDPERAEYEQIEQEALAELRERGMSASYARLAMIGKLRKAIGQVKAARGIEWADEFLTTTGKQLVVFAYHKDIQHALLDGLRERGHRAARILGNQRGVEQQKADFQSSRANVIVCSIKAAGIGHTLVAASDVLFVEQAWTPADHDQAEDRCHRIGQADAVTAWYLLGPDTIDEWVYELVEGKRDVVSAITDDIAAQAVTDHVVARLLEKYGA